MAGIKQLVAARRIASHVVTLAKATQSSIDLCLRFEGGHQEFIKADLKDLELAIKHLKEALDG